MMQENKLGQSSIGSFLDQKNPKLWSCLLDFQNVP